MVPINTEADFLRALSDHPEWKASVRALATVNFYVDGYN